MTMLTLASESSPVEVAWTAYDAKMLEVHAAYGRAASERLRGVDRPEERLRRMQLSVEASQLYDEFCMLFYSAVEDDDPRPAA